MSAPFFKSITLIGAIVLLFFFPLVLHAASYQQLEEMLAKSRTPEPEFIEDLPEPSTAHQFYLYSRVATDFSRAQAALISAVEKSSGGQKNKYLIDWVRIVSLGEPGSKQLNVLKRNMPPAVEVEPRLWLEAGNLAEQVGNFEQAEEWYKNALESQKTKPRALLGLIRVALVQKSYSGARDLLEEYILQSGEETRPEYWLLKGKYFQEIGSDSEAYVAYSHIIRHYPDSLVLAEAEEKIAALPLPEKLLPSQRQNPPEPSGRPATTSGGPYWVQVGSFTRRSQAESLASRVKRQFKYEPVIKKARVSGRIYYRVRIGGFPTKTKASEILKIVKEKGLDGFIARQ
jgi:tetratricopeptide (TPR) repeat protein